MEFLEEVSLISGPDMLGTTFGPAGIWIPA